MHVRQSQIATLWTIDSPSIVRTGSNDIKFGTRVHRNSPGIVQMTSDLALRCRVTCQNDVCMHHALPIRFEIFRKFMQKTQF